MREVLSQFVADGLYFHHAKDNKPDADHYHMHAHEHYEVFFFIAGKGVYMVEGSEYTLEPGCILIMRPAETHRLLIDPTRPYERLVIEFSESIIKPIDPNYLLLNAYNNRDLGKNNKYTRRDFPHTLSDYITDICIYQLPHDYMRFNVVTTLINLLNHINFAFEMKIDESVSIHSSDISKELVEYINNHLFEDLNLSNLCNHFFLSDSHLGRLFKAATGSSIAKYISIKRLLEARKRISEGLPPTVAAIECGYNDYSSFYRAYVKRFGVSPSSKN
ncbi:MAG: helix-turn-helix protein [Oscillospiraceae bacterium]|nr:helix-turn-helix protein [Oscillospiraceae bacterium]